MLVLSVQVLPEAGVTEYNDQVKGFGSFVQIVMLGVQLAGTTTVVTGVRTVLWLDDVGGRYQFPLDAVKLCPAIATEMADGLLPDPADPVAPVGPVAPVAPAAPVAPFVPFRPAAAICCHLLPLVPKGSLLRLLLTSEIQEEPWPFVLHAPLCGQ